MPGLKPWEFFDTFVKGNQVAWDEKPYSVVRAFNLAIAVSHLADHYFRYFEKENHDFVHRHGKNDKGLNRFRAVLIKREPYFKVIQDMANVYKHLYTRASCAIASGGAIEYLEYDGEVIEPQGDNGRYEIVIRHRDGKTTKFSEAIGRVMQMWGEIIDADQQPAI
jgi:hypothetical protein